MNAPVAAMQPRRLGDLYRRRKDAEPAQADNPVLFARQTTVESPSGGLGRSSLAHAMD